MESEMHENRNGTITAGLTTGIIGTVLGGLATTGTGSSLLGLGGNKANYVTKDEFAMGQALSLKDSEIALLKSENNTETKIVDTYKEVASLINALRDKVDNNRNEQQAFNSTQMAINSTTGMQLNTLNCQLAQITRYAVPNSVIMPGWGNVQVTPVLSAT